MKIVGVFIAKAHYYLQLPDLPVKHWRDASGTQQPSQNGIFSPVAPYAVNPF
jgi:hypothetical protein